jgi:hypothetical protein
MKISKRNGVEMAAASWRRESMVMKASRGGV